jgi:hypothetical protein
MSVQLTDMQQVLLSAAAIRDDRLLALPPNLKGGAANNVAAKLTAACFTREVRAKAGAPVWRRDAKSDQTFALKLTVAGLKAAGSSSSTSAIVEGEQPTSGDSSKGRPVRLGGKASLSDEATAPRDGTKISEVVGLLKRESGATIDEVVTATGWLPQTSRAALTGLRKRGYPIERRERPSGPRGYVIVAPQSASA